jgi:very-short-patch-repair endonuclease
VSKSRPVSDEERDDIVRLYKTGVPTSVIVAKHHRSAKIIRQVVKDAGIKLRFSPFAKLTASSPIEARLHNALKTAGIGFVTHKSYIKSYITDIRINQALVLIEADGIQHTWYDNPERDALRDARHAAIGFRTFRFTGSEINADAMACIQRVIDECNLVPDEDPVYDIRMSFSGQDHPRWINDRQEYTCEVCSTPFTRRRAYYTTRRGVYCSGDCYYTSLQGRTLSVAHKTAISIGNIGKHSTTPPPLSVFARAKISVSLKGRKKSPEHVAKVATALRGKTVGLEQRAKISASVKALPPMSIESRAKISAALTGKKKSPEHVAKVAEANRGRSLDPETRAKLSESVKNLPRIWCDECQRDWNPGNWTRHIRKYHEGGKW